MRGRVPRGQLATRMAVAALYARWAARYGMTPAELRQLVRESEATDREQGGEPRRERR